MQYLKIPIPLAQRIVDYLAQRPYVEVADLIAGLVQAGPENVPDSEPLEPQPSTKNGAKVSVATVRG